MLVFNKTSNVRIT